MGLVFPVDLSAISVASIVPSVAMRSTVQEIAHEPRHLVGLLEMRHVPGAVDQLDAGAGYPLCKLLGVGRCDQLIPHSPR